jgi:hypothetical protein
MNFHHLYPIIANGVSQVMHAILMSYQILNTCNPDFKHMSYGGKASCMNKLLKCASKEEFRLTKRMGFNINIHCQDYALVSVISKLFLDCEKDPSFIQKFLDDHEEPIVFKKNTETSKQVITNKDLSIIQLDDYECVCGSTSYKNYPAIMICRNCGRIHQREAQPEFDNELTETNHTVIVMG